LQTAATDIALWNAFKEGDRLAFTELFRRYYNVLMQYGNKLHGDPNLVEDCIQELFIELWQSRSRPEVQSVKAYLLRAVKYKIFRVHKKNIQTVAVAEDMAFQLSHENFIMHREEDGERNKRLIEALSQLPNRQREIMYLKLYQQLSYEELSEVMQINYQAARNLFYQAIKSLRKLLA
jgi:RNA polymerase sigma-70 factor (ECF subfamily)